MKTLTFSHIQQIQDFQFITDSSGVLLDDKGQLYKFKGGETELIKTPENFHISHFHFINENQGAIVGSSVVPEHTPKEGTLGSYSLLLLPILLLLWLGTKALRTGKTTIASAVLLFIVSGLVISCSGNWQSYKSPDPGSRFSTIITSNQLRRATFHAYPVNKENKSFISITHNQGQNWTTHQLPTHFYPTAIAAVGNNFIVGTYANQTEGNIPLHADGDLYFYGNDSTYNKRFASNNTTNPYTIAVNRGVNGIRYFEEDSVLFVFGSERMPTFPKNEVSSTNGNIYQIHTSLLPDYKIIDVPDTVFVTSLSISKNGLWVTLDNKTTSITDGKQVYIKLDSKKLLHFRNGTWADISIKNLTSFRQVEFIRGTARGYVLSEDGEVFETLNNGTDWQTTGISGISYMRLYKNTMVLCKGGNQLVFLQNS
ncbi:hypothetical protein H7F15_09160 [Pontibacter sp. Tf4]|uniref:hypothetical protein n=1 Tax=Pontibacter sp. Tf4 TaxID=2761620 RepID=UPI001624F66C|nr:hypothetical protein [Pontibacter sp. Tf4]MBB6611204.1 hypothetical protein [Pontibacter sp. Tf4]